MFENFTKYKMLKYINEIFHDKKETGHYSGVDHEFGRVKNSNSILSIMIELTTWELRVGTRRIVNFNVLYLTHKEIQFYNIIVMVHRNNVYYD